jgi:hypothetical protein
VSRQCEVALLLNWAPDTREPQLTIPYKECSIQGSKHFGFDVVWKYRESLHVFLWDLVTYLAKRIDNSTVHLVLRGSTAGLVQNAS